VSDRQKLKTMASMLLEALWTTEVLSKDTLHNKRLKRGSKEWPKNWTKSKTLSCNNCGDERIFKMPEPNSLGKGSSL
jgi:hypothetical protein